jgi:hypothetical protein
MEMTRIKNALLVTALFSSLTAQEVSLHGEVKDEVTGLPVAAASVALLGGGLSDTTDSEGKFDITGSLSTKPIGSGPTLRPRFLAGRGLAFSLATRGLVDIEILDLEGRRNAISIQALDRGKWIFNPGKLRVGMHFGILRSGQVNESLIFAVTSPENGIAGITADGAVDGAAFRKPGAQPESLRVSKEGYATKIVPAPSLIQTAMTIALFPEKSTYDGEWSGTTSQNNLPVTFSVKGGLITAMHATIRASYLGSSCTYVTGAGAGATAISEAAFSVAMGGGTVSTTLRGKFTSAAAVNGTIDAYELSGLICDGIFSIGTPINQSAKTWQAVKTGPAIPESTVTDTTLPHGLDGSLVGTWTYHDQGQAWEYLEEAYQGPDSLLEIRGRFSDSSSHPGRQSNQYYQAFGTWAANSGSLAVFVKKQIDAVDTGSGIEDYVITLPNRVARNTYSFNGTDKTQAEFTYCDTSGCDKYIGNKSDPGKKFTLPSLESGAGLAKAGRAMPRFNTIARPRKRI